MLGLNLGKSQVVLERDFHIEVREMNCFYHYLVIYYYYDTVSEKCRIETCGEIETLLH